MFFRIWCLYVMKLAMICVVAAMFGFFASWGEPWDTIFSVAKAVMIVLCLFSAFLGAWLALVKRGEMECPICGAPGRMVMLSQFDVGVECESCGLAHANTMLDFKVKVEPLDYSEDDEDWDEEEEQLD